MSGLRSSQSMLAQQGKWPSSVRTDWWFHTRTYGLCKVYGTHPSYPLWQYRRKIDWKDRSRHWIHTSKLPVMTIPFIPSWWNRGIPQCMSIHNAWGPNILSIFVLHSYPIFSHFSVLISCIILARLYFMSFIVISYHS